MSTAESWLILGGLFNPFCNSYHGLRSLLGTDAQSARAGTTLCDDRP